MSDLTESTSSGLGAGELAELARRGLEQWRSGPGAAAEQMEVCDCCGEWIDFEHPRDREMADQWREAMAERARLESLRAGGSGPGWPGPETPPDDAVTGWTGSRTPEWYLDDLL